MQRMQNSTWVPFRKYAAIAIGALMSIGGLAGNASAADKPKVYFSMGFVGNNWMTEARNMITALAGSDGYRDKINFEIQSAGGNAQQQIQQISGMVQAGAKAVIIYRSTRPRSNRSSRVVARQAWRST
jgi:ribose transport system substrate-binding protein